MMSKPMTNYNERLDGGRRMSKVMEVYKRYYDNPLKEDGTEKDNEFLGKFEIEKTLMEDIYAGRWVGVKDGKKYLIEQTEVSGRYNPGMGGSEFTVEEL